MPELSHTFFMAFVLSTFHKFSLSLSLSPPVPPMVPVRFPLSLPWSPMAPRELASIGLPVCLSRSPLVPQTHTIAEKTGTTKTNLI